MNPANHLHLLFNVACLFSLLIVPLLIVIHKITKLEMSFPYNMPNTYRLQMSGGLMDPLSTQAAEPVAYHTNRSIGIVCSPLCTIKCYLSSLVLTTEMGWKALCT